MFGRKKSQKSLSLVAQTVPKNEWDERLCFSRYEVQTKAERELYASLRESVPIIDAAIGKIIRLIGGFKIVADNSVCQRLADDFVKNVRTNGAGMGLYSFVCSYLDSLLTYGEAVGEMIPNADGRGIAAMYNASLDDVDIRADGSPLNITVCRRDKGESVPVKYQNLVLPALLNQRAGTARGESILKGLPFVSSILLRIFGSVKTNWERVGDVRFAVTYNPSSNGGMMTEETARQIADEWKKAMRSDNVCDFISVGDVSVKVIGAENQIPDCEVPVRTILEQILAKLGIPPFLLGISWSSTERMSAQQADILTSELEYYRATVEPVISKTVGMHLRLAGYNCGLAVVWDDINLQDAVELSQARLNNAQAARIEKEIGLEVDEY